MSYASHTRRPNPAALAGALALPAGFAALLVVGLAVKGVIAEKNEPVEAFFYDPVPIPPPPPEPVEPSPSARPQQTTATAPSRPEIIPFELGAGDPIETLPGVGEIVGPLPGPVDFGIPGPTPSASPFDPVGAKPRGNPGRWVTDADYKTRWIREGLTGKAAFALAIDAAGKVTACKVTRSSGHAVLDEATCDLVSKRARFDAARDGTGKPVAGSFTGSITWRIP
ncbi:MAG: TonB family protein [Porphyrobacter sp.]|nr:TonB family protein [Porphyrobacter sp.]